MKVLSKAIVLTVLVGLNGPVNAQLDNSFVSPGAEWCFGSAMVGFDSVINSRLGVPPEHALNMVIVNNRGITIPINAQSTELLTVIFDAYLWQGSPHDYAVNVFYDCATRQAPIMGASK